MTDNRDELMALADREAATRIESDAKRIAELEADLAEARLLVTEANNSLFGSQGYFHSLNGGPFDKYHLSRAIEDLKESAIAAERALSEETERCALLADGYPCPDNQTEDYSSGFIDAGIFIATAIRSGKPDGKDLHPNSKEGV